ncbi:MAG: PAC2 family protein [Actinobacteria bacterium]|nr:PAC2 family protein [Actinomycetota bacterium]
MADHVSWGDRPTLRNPVLITSFEGWSDAADAASSAGRYLTGAWGARTFATIDPEEFYDFTAMRPKVRLDDNFERRIEWPANQFSAAAIPGGGRDAIFLVGVEPGLKWRTFCDQVVDVANQLRVDLVISLGALAAGVPHTSPVTVMGTTTSPDLADRWALGRSRYEGPTGIVGALNDALGRAGFPVASLWAALPHYVSQTPSPKGALALVEAVGRLLEVTIATTDLEIAAASYVRQVDEVVEADSDVAEYVRRLEEDIEEGDGDDDEDVIEEHDLPGGDALAAEVERYLREHRSE